MKIIKVYSPKYGVKHILVDNLDYAYLSKFNWSLCTNKNSRTMYAKRNTRKKYKQKCIFLHRQLLDVLNSKIHVDHINGNGLDNRRCNLRLVSHQNNIMNSRKPINNTSGYKGVSLFKRVNKWTAYIKVNYKKIHLGYFNTKLEAAKAYNNAAIKYFGVHAKLNVIRSDVEKVSIF